MDCEQNLPTDSEKGPNTLDEDVEVLISFSATDSQKIATDAGNINPAVEVLLSSSLTDSEKNATDAGNINQEVEVLTSSSATCNNEKKSTDAGNVKTEVEVWISPDNPNIFQLLKSSVVDIDNNSPVSLKWKDTDLDIYAGIKYTCGNHNDIVKIGKAWLKLWYTGNRHNFAKATVWLALNLLDPKTKKCMFNPLDQGANATEGILSECHHHNFCEELEGAASIVVIRVPRHGHRPRLTSDNAIDKVTPDEAISLIESIERMQKSEQACLYTFLAAIACRVITKSPSAVQRYLRDRAIDRFVHFYNIASCDIVLPEPQHDCLQNLEYFLKPGSHMTVALMKAFLKAKVTVTPTCHYHWKDLLEDTLLLPTSMNGLFLVRLALFICRLLEVSNFNNMLMEFYDENFETSILRLHIFASQFLTSSNQNVLYPWSRVIHPDYFQCLDVVKNRLLTAFLVGIIEPHHCKELWKTMAIQLSRKEHTLIHELLVSIHNLHKWKMEQILNESPIDVGHNIAPGREHIYEDTRLRVLDCIPSDRYTVLKDIKELNNSLGIHNKNPQEA